MEKTISLTTAKRQKFILKNEIHSSGQATTDGNDDKQDGGGKESAVDDKPVPNRRNSKRLDEVTVVAAKMKDEDKPLIDAICKTSQEILTQQAAATSQLIEKMISKTAAAKSP